MKRRNSLRVRLTVWFTALLILFGALGGLGAYIAAQQDPDNFLDDQMREVALDVVGSVDDLAQMPAPPLDASDGRAVLTEFFGDARTAIGDHQHGVAVRERELGLLAGGGFIGAEAEDDAARMGFERIGLAGGAGHLLLERARCLLLVADADLVDRGDGNVSVAVGLNIPLGGPDHVAAVPGRAHERT